MSTAVLTTVARADVRAAALGFAAVAVPGFDDGGYFPRSWGWSALGFAALVALVLLLRKDVVIGPLEWVALGSIAALALWIRVSTEWGIAGTEAVRESERTLVYVTGLAAFLVLVEASSAAGLLVGVLSGVFALCAYGLADRVIRSPSLDPFEGSLLVEPLGYANALGLLAAMGVVLGLGLLTVERRAVGKAPLVVAVVVSGVALGLTSSRGARISLVVGMIVLCALYAAREHSLVTGRWLLVAAALVAALLVGFAATSPSWSFGDRPDYWRAALDDAGDHPLLGSGAGSFDDYWYAQPEVPANVRDAHSLYLETLAELGVVGLALVLGVLVPPLASALVARKRAPVAAAAGAYVAFVVHVGLDWDWEIPATMLAGLACGAALLAAARPEGMRPLGPRTRATGIALAVGLCVFIALEVLPQP